LDLYRCVHDLKQTDYRNIPEYSVYYDSCLEWNIDSEGFTLMGYNGKVRHLKTTTVGNGISDFKSEWSQGMSQHRDLKICALKRQQHNECNL